VTRAQQAGLRVEDIARSMVGKLIHRYKLDAKTRAAVALSAKTPLEPSKPRRDAKKTRRAKAKT
jgi:hypothetical protein